MTGSIKFFTDAKGWGFLTPDDGGNDLFFHHSSLVDAQSIPSDGQACEFEIGADPIKGRPCAINVKVI
jgi:cold shock protein